MFVECSIQEIWLPTLILHKEIYTVHEPLPATQLSIDNVFIVYAFDHLFIEFGSLLFISSFPLLPYLHHSQQFSVISCLDVPFYFLNLLRYFMHSKVKFWYDVLRKGGEASTAERILIQLRHGLIGLSEDINYISKIH